MDRKNNVVEFACGKIEFQDIIACSLSLKKSEYKLFEFLVKEEKPLTIADMIKKLNLDRTTVQKVLKNFLSKNLVQRYQQNLDNGGYVFRYIVRDRNAIKKHIKNMLTQWYQETNYNIDKW